METVRHFLVRWETELLGQKVPLDSSEGAHVRDVQSNDSASHRPIRGHGQRLIGHRGAEDTEE
jgi:hypothetical protein